MDLHEFQRKVCRCDRCGDFVVGRPACRNKIYERYVPKELKVLVVSESPPPGPKPNYLYNLRSKDRLRRVLGEAFGIPQEEVVDYLMRRGVFWSTAIKCRPSNRSSLVYMWRNCAEILAEEIKLLNPPKIVVLGKYAWKTVNRALNKIGVSVKLVRDHHPLYMIRFEKHRVAELPRIIFDP